MQQVMTAINVRFVDGVEETRIVPGIVPWRRGARVKLLISWRPEPVVFQCDDTLVFVECEPISGDLAVEPLTSTQAARVNLDLLDPALGLGKQMQDNWEHVARLLGEQLAPNGPEGYASMSPSQWYQWALGAIRGLTPKAPCEWKIDSNDISGDTWESGCGETWQFIEGGPVENRVTFCHGCGGRVVINDAGQEAE